MREPVLAPGWPAEAAARPLRHADCVDLAARSAPNAAAWRARLLAARAGLRRARTLPNPAVNLAWEDFPISGGSGGPVQFTASLAYALEALLTRKRRVSAATHDLEAEHADLEAERAALAADVWHAYDDLVSARARTALGRELVALAERNRDAVARFVETGESARIEADRAEAEVVKARADAAAFEADARVRELELAFALGFARPVPLDLADPLTLAAAPPGDLEAQLVAAAEARPELRAAAARYAAALDRLHLAASRTPLLPSAGIGYRTISGGNLGVASLDVVLPVSDPGGAGGVEAAEGDAALLAAAADLRRTARRVAQEVAVAGVRLHDAVVNLEEYAGDSARRRVLLREDTERLFQAGEITYSELALAHRDEVEARLALLDAQAAAARAQVDFDSARGALDRAQDA